MSAEQAGVPALDAGDFEDPPSETLDDPPPASAADPADEALSELLERLASVDAEWDFAWLPAKEGPGVFLLFPDGPDTGLLARALVDGVRVLTGQARYTPDLQLQLRVEPEAVEGLREELAAALGPRLADFADLSVRAAPDDEAPSS